MGLMNNIFITGGAGYVGTVLVEKLLRKRYNVKVLDLFMYGEELRERAKDIPNLDCINGDIRDQELLKKVIPGSDALIHLACISNDPSFELNPELGKSINYDAFHPLVKISRDSGVKRFIYASSASVYGVKEEENVTEELVLYLFLGVFVIFVVEPYSPSHIIIICLDKPPKIQGIFSFGY